MYVFFLTLLQTEIIRKHSMVKIIIFGHNLNTSLKLNRSHGILHKVQFARRKPIGMSTYVAV